MLEVVFFSIFGIFFVVMQFAPFIIVAVIIIKAVKKGKNNVSDNDKNFQVEKLNTDTHNTDHSHSYVHKVEPIDEISVMKDDNSTIAQLNQKREEVAKENRADDRRSEYLDRNAAKNADMNPNITYGEKKVICSYCGAENIVVRGEQKTCYFCREKL